MSACRNICFEAGTAFITPVEAIRVHWKSTRTEQFQRVLVTQGSHQPTATGLMTYIMTNIIAAGIRQDHQVQNMSLNIKRNAKLQFAIHLELLRFVSCSPTPSYYLQQGCIIVKRALRNIFNEMKTKIEHLFHENELEVTVCKMTPTSLGFNELEWELDKDPQQQQQSHSTENQYPQKQFTKIHFVWNNMP